MTMPARLPPFGPAFLPAVGLNGLNFLPSVGPDFLPPVGP